MRRWPIANFVIMGLCVAVFGIQLNTSVYDWAPFVLDGWGVKGLFGHMWLHAGILHFVGNMIFLWCFGNAVCAKVGNGVYPLFFVAAGLAAAVAHNLFLGGRMLGASGAINGVVGAFLVFYPLNDVSCAFWIGVWVRRFSVSSFWLILLWFVFDLWGATQGEGGVAYAAHVGGFLAGFGVASIGLQLGWFQMESAERSLSDVLAGRKGPRERWQPAASRRPPETMAPPKPPRPGAPIPNTMVQMLGKKPADGPASAEPGRPPGSAPGRPAGSSEPGRPAGSSEPGRPASSGPGHPPGSPSPASAGEAVRLKCACGAVLRVPRSLSGRRAKCPVCSEILQVPNL